MVPAKWQKPESQVRPPASVALLAFCLALDEAFFEHLLVAEPQIGDIG